MLPAHQAGRITRTARRRQYRVRVSSWRSCRRRTGAGSGRATRPSNRGIASFGDARVVHTTLPFPGWGQQSVFISNCRRIRAACRIFLNFQLIIGYAKLNDGFFAAYGSRRTARGGCLDFPGCDEFSTPASRSSHDGVAAARSSCPSPSSAGTARRVYAPFADARRVYTPFRRGDS